MKLNSKHFGEIEIDENKIITFEEPLAGFPHCKEFVLLHDEKTESEDDNHIFCWLQSVDDGDVTFVLVNVFMIMPDYDPLINQDDIKNLGEYIPDDFIVYNIAVIPEDITKMSVNLKAPIVINTILKKGKQVIVTNEDYGVKRNIFEEIKNKK